MVSLPDANEHSLVTTSRTFLSVSWGLIFNSEVLLQWTLQYDNLDLAISVIMHL